MSFPFHSRLRSSALAVVLLTVAAAPAVAQIPETFTNLMVLPGDTDRAELIGTMRGFAGALGVRCNHCHVGEDPDTLQGYDFASDEKESKRTARLMMQMMQGINADAISQLGRPVDDRVEVKCVTCHRGQQRPWLIQDVLEKANGEGGTDGMLAKYSELRDEYYGSHTYDFGEFVLTSMAEDLARSADLDGAQTVLEANLGYFEDSIYTRILLGQVAMQKGDRDGAVAIFEEVLEMDPENSGALRMLERVKQ